MLNGFAKNVKIMTKRKGGCYEKIISTLTAVIMICALSAFGFAACLGNESDDRELSSQWSANWDAYRPNLNNPMPSEPGGGDSEEPEGGNTTRERKIFRK